MARICLITAHHLSFQPRALREADSLTEAGHSVRVVSRQLDPTLSAYDREIMSSRKWRLQPLNISRQEPGRRTWFIESLSSEFHRRLFGAGFKTKKVAIRSYLRGYDRLLSLAISEPADWFIAHTQPSLPVASEAARFFNARLGFDCEDLLAENGTDPVEVVNLIQERYLGECDYVTVPSKSIGARLKESYKLQSLEVLYNAMPLHLASSLSAPDRRPDDSMVRLHWFGQTIGAGRGVEEAIEALGLLSKEKVELHLRGRIMPGFRQTIEAAADKHGVVNRLFFHPLVPPGDLIDSMSAFDIGLALERAEHKNYSLTATNKIFTYLLAGLAIAATDTPGQREVISQVPAGGFLFASGDARALANGLLGWIADRASLRRAQMACWDAARERLCWDVEKEKLLALLQANGN